MEKSFKIQVTPNKFDVYKFELFIKALENSKLGQFKNGEIIYDDKDEKEMQALMDKYLLHNKNSSQF